MAVAPGQTGGGRKESPMTIKKSAMPQGGRVLRRIPAAAYLGYGLTKFDEDVKNGALPPGFVLWETSNTKVRAWTREVLDAHIDRRMADDR